MPNLIAVEVIATRIVELRGKKVMFDKDLAKLYGVTPKTLNQAVKRNTERFPDDFMFKLSWEEVEFLSQQIMDSNSRSQFVTLKQGKNIKYLPYAFTEHGISMLSSVLNSKKAIQINILIMRAFTKLREILLTHKELAIKIGELEKKYAEHDQTIKEIFEAIRRLFEQPPIEEKKKIGFHADSE